MPHIVKASNASRPKELEQYARLAVTGPIKLTSHIGSMDGRHYGNDIINAQGG